MAAWRYKIPLLVLKKYFTRSLHSPVFSLNFSLAGKGPFFTGKAKNMRQRRALLPGEGLRVHEGFYFRASSKPIDRKVF